MIKPFRCFSIWERVKYVHCIRFIQYEFVFSVDQFRCFSTDNISTWFFGGIRLYKRAKLTPNPIWYVQWSHEFSILIPNIIHEKRKWRRANEKKNCFEGKRKIYRVRCMSVLINNSWWCFQRMIYEVRWKVTYLKLPNVFSLDKILLIYLYQHQHHHPHSNTHTRTSSYHHRRDAQFSPIHTHTHTHTEIVGENIATKSETGKKLAKTKKKEY